jgi:hypothetical protein
VNATDDRFRGMIRHPTVTPVNRSIADASPFPTSEHEKKRVEKNVAGVDDRIAAPTLRRYSRALPWSFGAILCQGGRRFSPRMRRPSFVHPGGQCEPA